MILKRLILLFGALVSFPSRALPAPSPSEPSLAKVSEQAVDHLAEPLRIDLYYSPKSVPAELQPTGNDVLDILNRYAKAARGKLTWKRIDPTTQPSEEKRRQISEAAGKCGVEAIEVRAERDDEAESSSFYLGLCLTYGSQSRSLSRITSSIGLEFLITATIKSVTEKKPTIAFTTGHGELTPEEGLQALRPFLESDFVITEVNPSREGIGAQVAALVVGGPRQAFDDQGRREIDRFLGTGGNTIFLVDGAVLDEGGKGKDGNTLPSTIRPNDTGLDPLLAKYGFKVDHAFVANPKGAEGGVLCPQGNKSATPSPVCVAPLVKGDDSIPLFTGLSAVVFPYASPVDRIPSPAAGAAVSGTFFPLAETDDTCVSITGSLALVWQFKLPKAKRRGPFTFGYAFQGKRTTNASTSTPAGSAKPLRLVVIGDSDFISSDMLQIAKLRPLPLYRGGGQLFLNALQWLVEDEALAQLRTKDYRTENAAPPKP